MTVAEASTMPEGKTRPSSPRNHGSLSEEIRGSPKGAVLVVLLVCASLYLITVFAAALRLGWDLHGPFGLAVVLLGALMLATFALGSLHLVREHARVVCVSSVGLTILQRRKVHRRAWDEIRLVDMSGTIPWTFYLFYRARLGLKESLDWAYVLIDSSQARRILEDPRCPPQKEIRERTARFWGLGRRHGPGAKSPSGGA